MRVTGILSSAALVIFAAFALYGCIQQSAQGTQQPLEISTFAINISLKLAAFLLCMGLLSGLVFLLCGLLRVRE